MIGLEVHLPNRKTLEVRIDTVPQTCPFCHRDVEAIFLYGFYVPQNVKATLLFLCPSIQCVEPFIGIYGKGNVHDQDFYLNEIGLGYFESESFSSEIQSISKDFQVIYNEAAQAEMNKLKNICGVGYRKALEFLIKDYVISKNPTKKDYIESQQLMPCIKEHIKSSRIKDIAERAVWLGNDETHYVRKWEDKTVDDLKQLINLTVHWIESEIISDRLVASMASGKK